MPKVDVEDPFIVAVMIALAQKQRERRRKRGTSTLEQAETLPCGQQSATQKKPQGAAVLYKV